MRSQTAFVCALLALNICPARAESPKPLNSLSSSFAGGPPLSPAGDLIGRNMYATDGKRFGVNVGAGVVSSAGSAALRALSDHFDDQIVVADWPGVKCDGVNDDTAGINAAIAAGQSYTRAGSKTTPGVEFVISAGNCRHSGPITIDDTTRDYAFKGAGPGISKMTFTTGGNGFVIQRPGTRLAAHAIFITNMSVDNFDLDAKTYFNGAGVHVIGPGAADGGAVVLANVNFDGYWANPVWLDGTFNAILYGLNVYMPNWRYVPVHNGRADALAAFALPNWKTSPTGATPPDLKAQVASGIRIDSATNGGFAIDTKIVNTEVVGGLVGVDVVGAQGVYVANSALVANGIGLRWEGGSTEELLAFTGSYVDAAFDDLYLNGVDDFMVTGNFFQRPENKVLGAALPPWAAVWNRNGGFDTVDSNDIQGTHGGIEVGIWNSNDAIGCFTCGLSKVQQGNSFLFIGPADNVVGLAMGNDANTNGILATGNGAVEAGAFIDRTGHQNSYVFNSFPPLDYFPVGDDGRGSLTFNRPVSISDGHTDGQLYVNKADGNGTSRQAVALDGSHGAVKIGILAGHRRVEYALGASGASPLILTTDKPQTGVDEELAGVPLGTESGYITVFGVATCQARDLYATWHFAGTWHWNARRLALSSFSTGKGSADGGIVPPGWALHGRVDVGGGRPQVEAVGFSYSAACSAAATELMTQK